jgi:hypothetical protein
MRDLCRNVHGTRVLICSENGAPLRNERDAGTFLSVASALHATLVAVPVTRVEPNFFSLSTHVAGEIIQKFVNYRMRLAIIGDISAWQNQSKSFRDFVTEANRGRALWFVTDIDELERRLAPRH